MEIYVPAGWCIWGPKAGAHYREHRFEEYVEIHAGMYSEESLLFHEVDQMIHLEVFLCIMMHEFLMFPYALNASCHAYDLTSSNHHFLGSTGRHAWLSECAREFAKIFRRNQGKWHVWSWATSNSIRRTHGKLWFFQIWQCQSRLQDNVDWTSLWIVVSGQVYEICFWHAYRMQDVIDLPVQMARDQIEQSLRAKMASIKV